MTCKTPMCRIVASAEAEELQGLLTSNTMKARLLGDDILRPNRVMEEPTYMITFNSENERIKWKYFLYESEANGKNFKTIDKIRKALVRYEEFTDYAHFKKFNVKVAKVYKTWLIESKNSFGDPLSLSTIVFSLRTVQDFYKWLVMQNGYKKAISFSDIEYLNVNNKDRKKIRPSKLKDYPSLSEIQTAVAAFDPVDEIQMRNRALFAFLIVTGIRDGALIDLKLKHVNTVRKFVVQDSREVDTKFGKHINTKFFPIGDNLHQIVIDWVEFLRKVKLFNDNSPLFPKEGLAHDGNYTIRRGFLSSTHWKTAGPVREIVADVFKRAGQKPYPPHRFRDTLSVLGRELCKTPLEQKAWAQNLGHESPGTTFGVYGGKLTPEQQFDVIEALGANTVKAPADLISLLAEALGGDPKLLAALSSRTAVKEPEASQIPPA